MNRCCCKCRINERKRNKLEKLDNFVKGAKMFITGMFVLVAYLIYSDRTWALVTYLFNDDKQFLFNQPITIVLIVGLFINVIIPMTLTMIGVQFWHEHETKKSEIKSDLILT